MQFDPEILYKLFLNLAGIVLLLIMSYMGKKRHFQKKSFFLLKLFTAYFIIEIISEAILPLNMDSLEMVLHLIELLVLAFAIIKAVMFIIVEIFLRTRKGVEVPKIIQDTLFSLLYFIMLLVILKEVLNINLTSILTTSAVVTMVLGLSLQDNLSNLFAGLAIQLEKPFSIGEWVEYDGAMGKIKELSWRSVKMLTLTNDLLIVPNNKIINEKLRNLNRPTHLHISHFNVGVAYKHPPNQVKEVLLEVLRNEKDVVKEPKPFVRVTQYGDFSINYELRYYVTNLNRYLQIKDSVATKIWYAFKRDDIQIPFPIRDINTKMVTEAKEERQRQAEIDRRVDMLWAVDFFAPLRDEEMKQLAQRGRTMFYSAGEDVIKEGESGDSLFVILDGAVDVSITTDTGEKKRIASLYKDDFFGERSLMTGEKRNATITAISDCTLFVITKEIFKNVISCHQDVLEQISSILSRRELELKAKRQEVKTRVTSTQVHENSKKLLQKIIKFLGF